MPLILITGIPSSGKSTRALEIKSFFENVHERTVHLINENDIIATSGCQKNAIFVGKSRVYYPLLFYAFTQFYVLIY
jgi:protein KTI12